MEFSNKMSTILDESIFSILEFENNQTDRIFYMPVPFLSIFFYSLKDWKIDEFEWQKLFHAVFHSFRME
jgi:hypothetical protein